MFDAILFDLDGTLIDTESLSLLSGIAAFAEFGHEVDETFMHGLVGKDRYATAAVIAGRFPALDLDAFDRVWRLGFDARMNEGLPLKPFAHEILTALQLPRAIVTSSGRREAHRKLALTGLTDHFAAVITVDDVTAPKPAPEPYLLAATKLGVSPSRCLVFEDSETGAEAAHRAGMRVVQVPDLVATEGRFAHHVAPDLMAGARAAGLRLF